MTFVTKFDGRKEEFQKEKILRTCMRMHASHAQALEIVSRIEENIYEGITTKQILQMIYKELEHYRPEIKKQIDFREAISMLRSKPDFEVFIHHLLREMGYDVLPNRIIRGACVEHEVDGIAMKDQRTVLVEVKHHMNQHTFTGLDVCLVAQARMEDLISGYSGQANTFKFDRTMIVCNTKFSDHAKQYAACKNIELFGWRMPLESGLEQVIEEKKLYPITFIRGMDAQSEERLGNAGIVLLRQLVQMDAHDIQKMTGISGKKLKNFINIANISLSRSG